MIIFLSNFLALLIKVDAGESGNRDVFGALLVFINVVLVLAVLVTSWFATQQSVDDQREGENSFTMAKTMLTVEQYAANSARLTRSGRATRSSASSAARPSHSPPDSPAPAVRPGLLPSDRGQVWRGQIQDPWRQGSGETDRTEEVLPSMARDETVSSPMAGVWTQDGHHGSSWY